MLVIESNGPDLEKFERREKLIASEVVAATCGSSVCRIKKAGEDSSIYPFSFPRSCSTAPQWKRKRSQESDDV